MYEMFFVNILIIARQELFDLVKINDLKTYDDVLNTFGQRCMDANYANRLLLPYLLVLWNEMILKKGNATAQDSNDRFLANIQKGGTYSVVPRIPGGEITPDKLIVIGKLQKNIISIQRSPVVNVLICLVHM